MEAWYKTCVWVTGRWDPGITPWEEQQMVSSFYLEGKWLHGKFRKQEKAGSNWIKSCLLLQSSQAVLHHWGAKRCWHAHVLSYTFSIWDKIFCSLFGPQHRWDIFGMELRRRSWGYALMNQNNPKQNSLQLPRDSDSTSLKRERVNPRKKNRAKVQIREWKRLTVSYAFKSTP